MERIQSETRPSLLLQRNDKQPIINLLIISVINLLKFIGLFNYKKVMQIVNSTSEKNLMGNNFASMKNND